VAVAAGLGFALLAAFGFASAGGSSAGGGAIARAGALLFLAFNHVGVAFDATVRSFGAVRGGPVQVALIATPMLGTVLIVLVLFVAGRRLATGAGAAPPRTVLGGGLEGSKAAIPYTALCVAAALLAHLTVRPPGTAGAIVAGPFTVEPSFPDAVLWPLLLALTAGFAGGASASASVPGDSVGSRLRGAIVGGTSMVGVGLVLSFVGLLVLAAVDPSATKRYFGGVFAGSTARGLGGVGLTLLAVPNLATWVLYPAMGSCVALARTVSGAGAEASTSSCVLSYAHLPSVPSLASSVGGAGPPAGQQGHTPGGYVLFVVVPLVAVVAGGWLAGRSLRPPASGVGAGPIARTSVGALAGVVFAACSILVVLVSRLGVAVSGPGAAAVGGAQALGAGPAVVPSVLLALAWGVVGGAAGALIRRGPRVAAQPVRERVFPAGWIPTPPAERSG
jgi:hypothetical protein